MMSQPIEGARGSSLRCSQTSLPQANSDDAGGGAFRTAILCNGRRSTITAPNRRENFALIAGKRVAGVLNQPNTDIGVARRAWFAAIALRTLRPDRSELSTLAGLTTGARGTLRSGLTARTGWPRRSLRAFIASGQEQQCREGHDQPRFVHQCVPSKNFPACLATDINAEAAQKFQMWNSGSVERTSNT